MRPTERLTHIADNEWRSAFMGDNPMLAPRGYGVAKTPWGAVQDAAWAALKMGASA
jgi:hypothetical protein